MKGTIKYLLFILATCAWTTLCFVVPDFLDNPINSWQSIIILVAYAAALGIFQFLLLNIICLNRWVCAIALPIYGIGGAIVSYYRIAYNATITPVIVEVTLHTNQDEMAGVISWVLIVWILINLTISICFILWRHRYIRPNYQPYILTVGIIVFFAYYFVNSRLKQSINQRYPANLVVSTVEYWRIEKERGKDRIMPTIVKQIETDTIDVILIFGEAMRADHLSLNGYERETCPKLKNQSNLITLKNIYSEYSHTAASLPHILTPADSLTPERAYTNSSLVRCFSEQGYSTAWLSNQDYGRTYSTCIQEADTIVFPNANKSVFIFHPWYDEDLLYSLYSLININDQQNKTHNLYVLHSIGSHWYYNNHVPDSMQIFQPVTTARVAKQNTTEQMINSYDNTAYYLDYLLSDLISHLQNRTAIVFYQSDHGEALGEDGAWLHANDAPTTHYPAALVWYSDKYAALFPNKIEALKQNSTKHYRTDYFFHSVLSAVGLVTDEYREYLDIFHINN